MVTHLVCEKLLLTKFHHFAWAVAQLVATVLAARQLLELPKPKSKGGFHRREGPPLYSRFC